MFRGSRVFQSGRIIQTPQQILDAGNLVGVSSGPVFADKFSKHVGKVGP